MWRVSHCKVLLTEFMRCSVLHRFRNSQLLPHRRSSFHQCLLRPHRLGQPLASAHLRLGRIRSAPFSPFGSHQPLNHTTPRHAEHFSPDFRMVQVARSGPLCLFPKPPRSGTLVPINMAQLAFGAVVSRSGTHSTPSCGSEDVRWNFRIMLLSDIPYDGRGCKAEVGAGL